MSELHRLLQTAQHDRVAGLEIHGPAGNEVRVLPRIKLLDGGNAVAKTHDVGVDPPTPLFGEKPVSEMV